MRHKGDPLAVTTALFNRLRQARTSPIAKEDASAALEMFLNRWPNTTREGRTFRWNYNQPYNQIAPGWWSGMDVFLSVVVLIAADEIYERPDYRQLALKALHSALRSPLEGGSLWKDDNLCWISEYSWNGMTRADEFYVLNGHLFGLQALKMAADALNDKEAEEAFQCGVRGTKAFADRFQKPDWSLYMLNKPTIDPAHYVVFELSQFDALYQLSGLNLFRFEAEKRRRLFAYQYPIYLDHNGDIVMSRFGAPHPYNLDIYPTRISCDLPDGTSWTVREKRQKNNDSQIDRGIIRSRPPAVPLRCTPISMMGGHHPIPLYTAVPRPINDKMTTATILPSTIEAQYDAELIDNREVIVRPEVVADSGPDHYSSVQARVTLTGKFDISNVELFGVEITMPRPSYLSVTLTDSGGRTASRYYHPLSGGKQIVLLSKVGFDGYEELSDIVGISISLPTDEKSMSDQSRFQLKIGEVVKFPSAVAFEHYLRTSDRSFPEAR